MIEHDWTGVEFVRACGPNGGNCVEFASRDGLVGLRDSKNPDGPTLTFTADEWAAFAAGVVNGEFAVQL